MDYEHDDRRAADVPGVPDAEGSGLPAGREPIDAGSPSSRSPEVYAVDPNTGSGLGPSEVTASGPADDLFDAMFLSGGFRPPAFAAVDHDLGFPPPQAPDLASAFLAALDAIDDRRFVTPVPEEPPAAPIAPVETAAGGPVYELRPQSQLELESESTSEPVEETPAEPVSAVTEDAARLPWDTGRVPVAGLLTMGEIAVEKVDEEDEEEVEEFASAENAELIEPIEEAAYFAAGLDGNADADGDDAEAAAVIAAEAEAEAELVAAAAAQDEADAEAAAIADAAAADAEAEALALAIEEAEQAELAAAIAAEAALDETSGEEASGDTDGASWGSSEASVGASAGSFGAVSDGASIASAFGASLEASPDASLDDEFDGTFDAASDVEALDAVSLDAGALDGAAFDAAALEAVELDASPDAASVESLDADLALAPDDEDFELEPSIGMEPMDAAPMTFDGPDAFAPAAMAAAEPEPEPEPESDELEDLQDFVVFSLGDMRCVVPIRNVVEVGRIPDAAPVPNAPVWLYGLGNLRGQVLSLIDLRAFFGVGRIKASAGRMVVLRGDSDDITAGVMVDQVHQIVALSPSRFKEAPAGLPLPERSTEFVWGACDYGNYTMIGLDVDGVLGVESLTEETV